MSEKPTIFFSHSSADKYELARLKELFVAKTGGSIDVFLSSDGESIKLGVNWVHSLEEALEKARLMFVFVSPHSLKSSWLYFESGYSYSKKIRVVPVGFKGVDLATLSPPLSLLQGFNVTSVDQLNNLVSMANEVFGHSHESYFSEEEFREVANDATPQASRTLGAYAYLVNEISLDVTERNLTLKTTDAVSRTTEILTAMSIEHARKEGIVSFPGVRVVGNYSGSRSPESIDFEIDPLLADYALPIINEVIGDIRIEAAKGLTLYLSFTDAVACVFESHRVSARLFNTAAKIISYDRFEFEGLRFHVWRSTIGFATGNSRPGPPLLSIENPDGTIVLERIHRLLDFLFARRILFPVAQAGS